jgi:3',5'-cyclic-AMP phosphodiesterase
MTDPFLLVQLSDPHIGATWAPGDPVAGLAAAVALVHALEPGPSAVLLSGDLADHAADDEYERIRDLLDPLHAPLYVLAGNHDDRGALRRHFGVPGTGEEPVQYAVELGPLRLVVLDTTRPGHDDGELDADRLAWLDAELAAAPETPTLLAMHHPPVSTGIPAMDRIGLPLADRHALGRTVERHPQVRRLVAGHLHQTIAADFVGRAVLTLASTYVQTKLDFRSQELRPAAEPAAFAVHRLVDGDLVSHVQPVPPSIIKAGDHLRAPGRSATRTP